MTALGRAAGGYALVWGLSLLLVPAAGWALFAGLSIGAAVICGLVVAVVAFDARASRNIARVSRPRPKVVQGRVISRKEHR